VSLSVLAFGGEARGVTLTGVQYELHDGVMTDAFPLGHGNHITADEAAVTVTDGVLFVVESKIS
jgi:thiamine pyrophosphokinase